VLSDHRANLLQPQFIVTI